jgi:hypothetical protein
LRLSDAQFEALLNLSRKNAGEAVGWISIAEAQHLTELGFATRGRAGWLITPAGEAMLAQGKSEAEPEDNVVAMRFATPPIVR